MRGRPAYAFKRKDCHSDDSTAFRHSFVNGSHGSRTTGGIFCWYCRHEICYGYYIMPNAEGRNEAFSFLYKYFAVAPKVVVYDFSCALQDYCLNRQPDHFIDTLFLVDKFHWFGQTACSRTYNLTQYPAYAGLNSQIAEQFNSALARIKCSQPDDSAHLHVQCQILLVDAERKETSQAEAVLRALRIIAVV